VEEDYQDLGTPYPPAQQSFFSYRWLYKNYPKEVLKVTTPAVLGYQYLRVEFTYDSPAEFVYPGDTVLSYYPGPPFNEPVPNPNGITSIDSGSTVYGVLNGPHYPRWDTDTPYDFSANPGYWGQMIPPPGFSGVLAGIPPNQFGGPWSWDISVANLMSEVKNLETDELEYYPFAQATTSFKATAKLKVTFETQICCWNEGTVIRGKIGFKSVNVTTTAVPSPTWTGAFNWAGLGYEIGDTYTDAGTANWEVTIEDGFIPPEVDIPKVEGSVTFVNDFWITEVVPPS